VKQLIQFYFSHEKVTMAAQYFTTDVKTLSPDELMQMITYLRELRMTKLGLPAVSQIAQAYPITSHYAFERRDGVWYCELSIDGFSASAHDTKKNVAKESAAQKMLEMSSRIPDAHQDRAEDHVAQPDAWSTLTDAEKIKQLDSDRWEWFK
jgi:hypothetical protein